MRETSTAAFAMRSIADTTCSTLDISSASRGDRAASTQIARISCTRSLSRSSSSWTSAAICSSPKNRAAYERSTINSEVSLASESMALRFRGGLSSGIARSRRYGTWLQDSGAMVGRRPGSSREAQDDDGQDQREGPEQVEGGRDDRDAVAVRV